jgi:hypothetical protein
MQEKKRIRKFASLLLTFTVTLCLVINCAASAATMSGGLVAQATDYSAAIEVLQRFIQHEMADKDLPGRLDSTRG